MPVSKDFYLQLRARAFAEADPVQRAANFLYLNRNCFNGIFRVNKHGQFNVPFSGCRTGRLPSLEDFTESAKVLSRAQLFHSDFEVLVTTEVEKHDFVYLDPPYTVRRSRMFRQYGHHRFDLHDLDRLQSVLRVIHSRGGLFLLSYADVDEITPIAKEWLVSYYQVRRNIAGFAAKRKNAQEVAISNFSPVAIS